MKKNQKSLTVAILSVAFFQMSMVALAPVLSAMTEAFPGATDLSVQLASTFLNLVLVLVALFAGRIAGVIGRRAMATAGMALYGIVGLCGAFLSHHLWTIYIWSGLLGLGTGLFVPATLSLILICYEEGPRQTVTSLQSASVNLGGVILSLLSGCLSAKIWSNAFFCYLLALPSFLLCLLYMPKSSAERLLEKPAESNIPPQKKQKQPRCVWLNAVVTFLFGIVYFTFSTNISFMLSERALPVTTVSGLLTGAFMLGGVICSLLCNPFFRLCRRFTPAAAFLLLGISYVVLSVSGNTALLLLFACIGGGSLSFIFPYLLLTVGGSVPPELTVTTSSILISIAPNLGSFVSPILITNLSKLLGNGSASLRFRIAAGLAMLCAVVLAICSVRNSRRASPNT